MWTAFVLFNLWCLHCSASSTPPSPIEVEFSSVNLRNVLHWLPGNGTPDDTHFTVEYAIYGDNVQSSKGRRVNWRAVQKCTKIARTWCDLSDETWDEEQGYYARVRAVGKGSSSKWSWTQRRFDPMSDTTFGPPLISVEIKNNSAIITLMGPMRYLSNNHTQAISMAAFYPQMSYNLSVHNTHNDQVFHIPVTTSPYKYQRLEYSTEYCFSAQSKFMSMPITCEPSVWHCITTPQDPVIEQLKKAVVGIVVPSFCICMMIVVGYILYHYLTGNGQKSPVILNPPSFHPSPLALHPEKVNHIPISPISAIMDPLCSNFELDAPPPEYSDPEENWDDSYGGVMVAPSSDGGANEASERTCDKGNNGSDVTGAAMDNTGRVPTDRVYAPQTRSSFSSVPQFRQTHVPLREEAEMSTHRLLHAWPQTRSVSQAQTQAQSFHQPAMGGVRAKRDNRGTDRNGKIDGGVEGGRECENVALLSPYVSQNLENMLASHSGRSDFLSDDYGIVAATEQTEEDGDCDDFYDEGPVSVAWDPETGTLQLPKMKQGGLDGLRQRGGEDEEEYVKKGVLKLENVFVRQTSEEEEEVRSMLERGGERGWRVEDGLTKWDLVVSMD
ncbi:interleukin-20 receptor subunit alpha [Mugil cephalus]|uniref:interleukin-20 receptor subunit alpha n=1 Tax=Mugil cephalus TaxID=48193 RepID=UPI001FB7F0FB|nr:interleukin-20 receptor subunit alpha [Mugil cephalus]